MSRKLSGRAWIAGLALVLGTGLASPVSAAPPEAAQQEQGTKSWSRAYGVGACVNCPGGTGLMAGEDVGRGLVGAASGLMDAVTAPLRPAAGAPPPEVFSQKPPAGYNCWVDAGSGRAGYWAKCP